MAACAAITVAMERAEHPSAAPNALSVLCIPDVTARICSVPCVPYSPHLYLAKTLRATCKDLRGAVDQRLTHLTIVELAHADTPHPPISATWRLAHLSVLGQQHAEGIPAPAFHGRQKRAARELTALVETHPATFSTVTQLELLQCRLSAGLAQALVDVGMRLRRLDFHLSSEGSWARAPLNHLTLPVFSGVHTLSCNHQGDDGISESHVPEEVTSSRGAKPMSYLTSLVLPNLQALRTLVLPSAVFGTNMARALCQLPSLTHLTVRAVLLAQQAPTLPELTDLCTLYIDVASMALLDLPKLQRLSAPCGTAMQHNLFEPEQVFPAFLQPAEAMWLDSESEPWLSIVTGTDVDSVSKQGVQSMIHCITPGAKVSVTQCNTHDDDDDDDESDLADTAPVNTLLQALAECPWAACNSGTQDNGAQDSSTQADRTVAGQCGTQADRTVAGQCGTQDNGSTISQGQAAAYPITTQQVILEVNGSPYGQADWLTRVPATVTHLRLRSIIPGLSDLAVLASLPSLCEIAIAGSKLSTIFAAASLLDMIHQNPPLHPRRPPTNTQHPPTHTDSDQVPGAHRTAHGVGACQHQPANTQLLHIHARHGASRDQGEDAGTSAAHGARQTPASTSSAVPCPKLNNVWLQVQSIELHEDRWSDGDFLAARFKGVWQRGICVWVPGLSGWAPLESA